MAGSIDIDKLKKDAFNAIDALFKEEDEDDEKSKIELPVKEKPQKTELIVSSMDDLSILDEFILALEWEYSEDEIKRFVEHLENIAVNNPDPYNKALVKMLNSIITYLIKAKNKAFPETFNILSEVISVLKQINSPNFDSMLIKSEVSMAYQKVKELKYNISDYNSKLRRNRTTIREFGTVGKRKKTRPVPVSTVSDTKIITIKRNEFIEDYEIFTKKTSKDKSSAGMIEPADFEQIGSKIIDRLDQYEQRLAFLEKQNQTLRQIITDQKENDPAMASKFPDTETGSEGFKFDDFEAEFAPFSPIKNPESDTGSESFRSDDPGAEFAPFSPIKDTEPETVDVSDFLLSEPEADEQDEEFLNEGSERSGPDISESDESNDYVRLFKLDGQDIAIPASYFNNIYKLPRKIKRQIHSMESIRLGELSSFFRKLSKNMKGNLQDLHEKELKKKLAPVMLLMEDPAEYQYVVLCSCNDDIILVPVSGKHETGGMVAGRRNELENRLSQFSVEIDNDVTMPLIVPC